MRRTYDVFRLIGRTSEYTAELRDLFEVLLATNAANRVLVASGAVRVFGNRGCCTSEHTTS